LLNTAAHTAIISSSHPGLPGSSAAEEEEEAVVVVEEEGALARRDEGLEGERARAA
jgi:hypothetical protein